LRKEIIGLENDSRLGICGMRLPTINERSAIFLPSTMISSWSGQSSAAKRFRSVVFPDPEEPTRITNSPGSISKEIFKRAGTELAAPIRFRHGFDDAQSLHVRSERSRTNDEQVC
jgi:hypothetical protein